MTRSPITIHDVADTAGVSASTVSLALNHPGRVSDQTRQRVLEVIDELGFVPKAEAVARARQMVGRIGILGPFTAHAAAARRLGGVLRGAAGSDLEIVVFDHDSAADRQHHLVAGLPRWGRLDGLLIASLLPDEPLIEQLVDHGLPTVLIDARHPRLSSVHTDDVDGGRLAAEHLLSLGERAFCYLGELQQAGRDAAPAQQRLRGFREALNGSGRGNRPVSVAWTPRSFEQARETARQLLDDVTSAGPRAVFASDDLLAAAVVQAAYRAGLRVPQDVAVVGFDDSDLANALDMTTVRQPLEESGELALQMITEQLRRPGPVRSTFLELRLVRRGSA